MGFVGYKVYLTTKIKHYNITLKQLNENIIKIITELNYDIYRPFNIYNCNSIYIRDYNCISCNIVNKNNILIKKIIYLKTLNDQNKLITIIKEMIKNKYIGAKPTYYYKKMLE
jgi:hypothetical protein